MGCRAQGLIAKRVPARRSRGLASSLLRALPLALVFATTVVPSAHAIGFVNAVSRKIHGTVGTFDLPILPAASINAAVSIEPRTVGSGHLIVFTFDEAVLAPGTVSVVDANSAPVGNVAMPVMNGSSVEINLADVPDRRRVSVTLTGVTGASGSTNATVFLGFLVGDFNDSATVSPQDVSACKARAGQTVDANSFRFDINANGYVSVVDIAATKSRQGIAMITGQPALTWQSGGWDLDVWQ